MTIVRIDAEDRWSDVVIHNNTLYYTGVPENLDADAFEQTANTLAQIDAVLEKQGSNKSRILDATIFLTDKSDFAAMNKAWDAWSLPVTRRALYRAGRVDEPEIQSRDQDYRRSVTSVTRLRPRLQNAPRSVRRYEWREFQPRPE